MPTYDYNCADCHQPFAVWQRMTAERPRCPDCGGEAERVFLCAPAVHGAMARGRELAARTFEPKAASGTHRPGCPCCR